MTFEIILAPEADIDLRSIRAFHRSEILDAIDLHLQYTPTNLSRSRIKRLRGIDSPAYRLRVGEYRVYYDVNEDARRVSVLRVIHKGDSAGYLGTAGGES